MYGLFNSHCLDFNYASIEEIAFNSFINRINLCVQFRPVVNFLVFHLLETFGPFLLFFFFAYVSSLNCVSH